MSVSFLGCSGTCRALLPLTTCWLLSPTIEPLPPPSPTSHVCSSEVASVDAPTYLLSRPSPLIPLLSMLPLCPLPVIASARARKCSSVKQTPSRPHLSLHAAMPSSLSFSPNQERLIHSPLLSFIVTAALLTHYTKAFHQQEELEHASAMIISLNTSALVTS
jgi:hypothetical protein